MYDSYYIFLTVMNIVCMLYSSTFCLDNNQLYTTRHWFTQGFINEVIYTYITFCQTISETLRNASLSGLTVGALSPGAQSP